MAIDPSNLYLGFGKVEGPPMAGLLRVGGATHNHTPGGTTLAGEMPCARDEATDNISDAAAAQPPRISTPRQSVPYTFTSATAPGPKPTITAPTNALIARSSASSAQARVNSLTGAPVRGQ